MSEYFCKMNECCLKDKKRFSQRKSPPKLWNSNILSSKCNTKSFLLFRYKIPSSWRNSRSQWGQQNSCCLRWYFSWLKKKRTMTSKLCNKFFLIKTIYSSRCCKISPALFFCRHYSIVWMYECARLWYCERGRLLKQKQKSLLCCFPETSICWCRETKLYYLQL